MSISFNPVGRFIPVYVQLFGPATNARVRLILDTGATRTLISRDVAVTLGYDLATATEFSQLITGSGLEIAPRISIDRIEALEQERRNFPVLCHNLPPSSPVAGLLGLDFFRDQRLIIDFRQGLVTLD